jgi:flagellin
MGLRINSNVSAINAQRNLFNTTYSLSKSMEKLSSGMRITRAGDESDIRALDQASRNALDGVSLVQTAEGALDEVSGMLLRLRELAQQSATDTLGDTERGYLNDEYQALLLEIDRISDSAEFNGKVLLDGSAGSLDIQVGITSGATSQVSIDLSAAMDSATLGLATAIDSKANALLAIDEIETASGTVAGTRGDFGAVQNRLESSIRNIGVMVENLSAANSRIRDVDIAVETSKMTSYQILQQAGISVLSQANLMPQMAISLLQR